MYRACLNARLKGALPRMLQAWPQHISTRQPADGTAVASKTARSRTSRTDKRSRPYRVISTLDPQKLRPQDLIDVSGRHSVSIYINVAGSGISAGPVQVSYREVSTSSDKPPLLLWPSHAQGYLYYHVPDIRHPATGALRFRCVDLRDGGNFSSGQDLLLPNGFPWSLTVASIISSLGYRPFLDLLFREGQVDHKLEQSLINMHPAPRKNMHVVHAFKQPFPLKTSGIKGGFSIWIAQGYTLRRASLLHTLDFPAGSKSAWLELADLDGLMNITLRFLKQKLSETPNGNKITPVFVPTNHTLSQPLRERVKRTAPLLALLPPTSTAHVELAYQEGSGWRRCISTLDPVRLRDSDFVDVSGTYSPSLNITTELGATSTAALVNFKPYRPFPLGTHGFFYFAAGPTDAPLTGQLRFRLTSKPDSRLFASGRDLELETGVPWNVPLVRLLHALKKTYGPIVALLEQDGILSSVGVHDASRLPFIRSQILHRPNDTFRVELASQTNTFWYTAGQVVQMVALRNLCKETWKGKIYYPLSGKILCRFEYDRSRDGTSRWAVIRVIDILEPISRSVDFPDKKRNRVQLPTVGGLLVNAAGNPWIYKEGNGEPGLDIAIKQAFADEALYATNAAS